MKWVSMMGSMWAVLPIVHSWMPDFCCRKPGGFLNITVALLDVTLPFFFGSSTKTV